MDIHGAVVTQCTLAEDRSIKSLLWSSEKFRMVNVSDNETEEKSDKKKRKGKGGIIYKTSLFEMLYWLYVCVRGYINRQLKMSFPCV